MLSKSFTENEEHQNQEDPLFVEAKVRLGKNGRENSVKPQLLVVLLKSNEVEPVWARLPGTKADLTPKGHQLKIEPHIILHDTKDGGL